MATFAVLRHQRLNSSTFDLAIKSQVIWNTYQGDLFASSIEVDFYLGDHVQLIMLLLAPLFALWEDVRVLLILQSILLGLAAFPLYRIAARRLQHKPLALAIAAAYLLYPTVGFINRFGFHPLTFVILFFLLAYDFLERERPNWATFFIFLALLCREDVGFTVFAFGLFVALAMGRRALGATWAMVGLAWSLTAVFVVIPHFRDAASDTLARYAWLGEDVAAMLQTILTRPGFVLSRLLGDPIRQQFLAKLLLPVGYLALLAPLPLAVGLPALAYNLLSDTPSQTSIYFQYIAPIIPFIFIATVHAVARLRNRFPRTNTLIAGWLAVAVLAAWALDNPFTTEIDDPYFPVYRLEQVTDADAFRQAAVLLPDDAPVATMMAYGPHLALRPELHLFYDRLKLEERPYGFPQTGYALLHLTDLRWGVNARIFYAAIETAIGQYGYEARYFQDDVVLLERSLPPQPATGAVLQRVIDLQEAGGKYAPTAHSTLAWMGQQWGRPALPDTAVSLPAAFDADIHLLGYELSETNFMPGRPLCTTLYWQTDVSLAADYTVFFHFTAADGYVHAQRDGQPAFGFHPTSAWQPDTVVADMHCLQIPPWLAAGDYQIRTGLYAAATGQRLPVTTAAPTEDDAVILLTHPLTFPK